MADPEVFTVVPCERFKCRGENKFKGLQDMNKCSLKVLFVALLFLISRPV